MRAIVDRAGEPCCGSARPSTRARRCLASTSPAALAERPPSGFSTASASQSAPSARRSAAARRLRDRRIAAAVGDGHHHRDQRDAVADAVVDARDQRRCRRRSARSGGTARAAASGSSGVVASSPTRACSAARSLWPLRAHELLAHDVVVDVEVARRRPSARADRVAHHHLAEALVLQQLLGDALAQRARSRAPAAAARRRRSSSG